MATATRLKFKLISGAFPNFGARYMDITRPGDTTQRFWYEGERGGRTTLTCRKYFAGQSSALSFRNQLNALQGREVIVEDELNSRSMHAFLHAVWLEPLKRIEASDGNDWAVIASLDLQRTS